MDYALCKALILIYVSMGEVYRKRQSNACNSMHSENCELEKIVNRIAFYIDSIERRDWCCDDRGRKYQNNRGKREMHL